MVESMGCEPSIIDAVGVTVKGHPDRAESRVTAGYLLGKHFVITCDPAVESMLQAAASGMEPTLEGWTEVAFATGGEFLGTGRMQLLSDPGGLKAPVVASGYELRTIRSEEPDTRSMVERLVEVSDDDDLDEAEIDLDDLDEVIHVAVGTDGEIAAYASARQFDLVSGYGDIGVLTHADHRGKGLGVAAVSALCERLIGEGLEPLYRCDEENAASMRLSESMGFVPATRLVGYRFEA